jgi:iron complex outermembrane recepter protein
MIIPRLITGVEICRKSLAAFCKILLFFVVFAMDAYAQETHRRYDFKINEETLSKVLDAIVQQTGVLVLYPPKLANKAGMKPVDGRYTVSEALDIVLKDTGFSGGLTERGVIFISQGEKNKVRPSEKNMRTKKSLLSAVIGFFVGSGGVQYVSAQDTGGVSMQLEEIVVTGSRAANRAAIAVKNDYQQIMDALSADDVGALPDVNIAEAFRRMPGVYTQFSEDEGRFVVVRGLSPELNLVTIDGMAIGSSDENSSQVNMEAIPAAAVKTLEVFKTLTPDLDGNAIGGTLNMVTRSAYDSADMNLSVSADLSQYSFDEVSGDNDLSGALSIGYSDTFGEDDQYGVVLSAGYDEKNRDGQNTFSKSRFDNGADSPPFFHQNYTRGLSNSWKRSSYAAKLEFKPSDELYLFLNNYYYNLEDDEELRLVRLDQRGARTYDDPNEPVSAQGRLTRDASFSGTETTTLGHHFHGEYYMNDMHLFSFDVAATSSQYRFPNQNLQFRADNRDELGYSFTYGTPPNLALNDPSYLLNASGPQYLNHKFELKTLDEDMTEIKFDYAFNADVHSLGWGAMAGAKFRRKDREFDREETQYNNFDEDAAGMDLTMAAFSNGASDWVPFYPNYPVADLNYDAFLDYFNNNQAFFSENPNNARTSTERDYTLTEDVTSFYARVQYAAERFNIIGGVRFERTELDTDGFLFDRTLNVATANSYSSSYNDVLPSISATYRITDTLMLRGAISESIGRPNPGDVKARETREVDDGNLEVEYDIGTPDLKPRRATNFDVSLENYFDDGDSIVAVAIFYKDIKDLILDTTIEGGTELVDGVAYDVIVNQLKNADTSEVTGVEFSFIKNTFDYDFLPDVFNGLGLSANATWLDAEMNVVGSDGKKLTIDHLEDQADFLFNASLFYNFEDRGEVRIAYNYTDSYSTGLRLDGGPEEERFLQAYEQVDLQGRYDITDNFSIRARIRNLTDHIREQETFFENAPYYRQEFGRSYWLGVSYNY